MFKIGKIKGMRVLLTGGGTLGPVTPLLAVVEAIRKKEPDTKFFWIGTRKGPEKRLVKEKEIEFYPIFSGKWRRYISFRNFLDLFLIKLGCIQSFIFLIKEKPNVIVSAGGFVAVPVIWSGWLLGIPIIIHQQDIQPGFANKLSAPFARKITTAFQKSLKDFSKKKTSWIGNPVREEILEGSKEKAIKQFNLEKDRPVLFVLGGGTGSAFINKLIIDNIDEFTNVCQIIHLTGGKVQTRGKKYYHPYKFLSREMAEAYAVSDVVVSRAGMGVLTEVSVLGKPSVLIPMTGHQEKNARYFENRHGAVVLNEKEITKEIFVREVKMILEDKKEQKKMSENVEKIIPPNAAEKLAEIILGI